MDSYFILWVLIHYSISLLKLYKIWPSGALSKWFQYSFDMSPSL